MRESSKEPLAHAVTDKQLLKEIVGLVLAIVPLGRIKSSPSINSSLVSLASRCEMVRARHVADFKIRLGFVFEHHIFMNTLQ